MKSKLDEAQAKRARRAQRQLDEKICQDLGIVRQRQWMNAAGDYPCAGKLRRTKMMRQAIQIIAFVIAFLIGSAYGAAKSNQKSVVEGPVKLILTMNSGTGQQVQRTYDTTAMTYLGSTKILRVSFLNHTLYRCGFEP